MQVSRNATILQLSFCRSRRLRVVLLGLQSMKFLQQLPCISCQHWQVWQVSLQKTTFLFSFLLKTRSAKALAKLLELCMERDPCPNPKIIKNLCSFVCSDPAVTPSVNLSVSAATEEAPASPSPRGQTESNCNLFSGAMTTAMERGNTVQCDQYNGILLLVQQQKVLIK